MKFFLIRLTCMAYLCALLFTSCNNPDTGNVQSEKKNDSGQPSDVPASEVTTKKLETSQTSSAGLKPSEAEIKKILSEFNTRKTERGLVLTIPEKVLFDFDKYNLRPDAREALEKISRVIQHYQGNKVEIAGHTDSKGSDSYNLDLSDKRANSVMNYLADEFGVDKNRLSATGYGEKQPVAKNENTNGSDNPEGRQQNRRVEVLIEHAS